MLNKRYSEKTDRQTDRLSLYFLRAIQSSYIGLDPQ